MATGVEEVGGLVEGGLLARAVEPRAGGLRADGRTGEADCLNCGAALLGGYCHGCGQHAHVHRTLAAFGHDLLHGVLHFEGKVWRTLPLLLWRPGELTRRYVHGERARFVSPLALFLFCVFLMFATISALGTVAVGDQMRNTRGELSAVLRHARADLAELQASEARERTPDAVVVTDLTDKGLEVRRAAELEAGRAPLHQRVASAQRVVALLEQADREITVANGAGPRANLPKLRGVEKGLNKLYENPSLAFYKMQNNGYKYSWLLIPLSVPFMWLLFPFSKRFHLYDHSVFVTYSLCFMTLLFVLVTIAARLGAPEDLVASLAIFVPPFHMYRQLRGAYELRRWSAAMRTLLLLLACTVVVIAFLAILILLGAVS